MRMLAEPDIDGCAILADYQAQGRGRQGRRWESPRQASVLCSVVLVDSSERDETHPNSFGGFLTLASAVACCEAIRAATDVNPAIKWPNDIRVNGRKLGGILIESSSVNGSRGWVVGIGLNCLQHEGHFPPELREQATSLDLCSHEGVDRAAVARELLKALDAILAHDSPADRSPVYRAWQRYAEPLGGRIRVQRGGEVYSGSVIEVDPLGGLVLQGDDRAREWFDPMRTSVLS